MIDGLRVISEASQEQRAHTEKLTRRVERQDKELQQERASNSALSGELAEAQSKLATQAKQMSEWTRSMNSENSSSSNNNNAEKEKERLAQEMLSRVCMCRCVCVCILTSLSVTHIDTHVVTIIRFYFHSDHPTH